MTEPTDVSPKPPLPKHLQREYLGDGVYAYFDGYQIWLSLANGTRDIALEPAVMVALRKYERGLYAHFGTKVPE